MTEMKSWSETTAGILARQGRRTFPGDDREERMRVRAEEQRELRVQWESQMDAADRQLAAEGRLDRPWRVARAEAEVRANEGAVFEVPNSWIRFRPANWLSIGPTRPPELEPLYAAAEAAKARMVSTNPPDDGYRQMLAEREAQLEAGRRLRRQISGPDVNETLPPSSRVF